MKIITIICFCFLTLKAFAEDIITIESTISGNEEQPRVVTIVPWKEPPLPGYLGEDINDIGEPLAVFQSLDRQTFSRERSYISSARKSVVEQ